MKKSEPLLSRKMQNVYSIAERYLGTINIHPYLASVGYLGYFISIENIKKVINLDPVEWYKNQKYKNKKIKLSDLPKEDQIKIKTVLDELIVPTSQSDLEKKCHACGRLANEFGFKILARKVDITEIKALIVDANVPDEKVKEEINKLDAKTIPEKESKEIISFLKKKRPDLFYQWQLEIAKEYM